MRSELVKSVVPPLVFVFVATLACVFLVGLYLPLISMIQGLV
jgi:type II secretory pathway component PulF